jgi:deaminated glutathione amidase
VAWKIEFMSINILKSLHKIRYLARLAHRLWAWANTRFFKKHGDIGKLGLCVCYDLRFPLMFQKFLSKGVEVIAVPTAFTVKTGMAHWEILTRTRSIDILSYGLFSCQVGTHSPGRTTYGHSMITNPWGEIVSSNDTGVGVITAEVDLQFLKEVRKNLPI